jgi:predicted Zn finger-like uncharacterized protein
MQITCPKCGAQYNINDAQIAPQGVSIKCPKCLHQFTAGGPGAVPLPGGGMGAVPLPGGGVPLPGGGIPLPGAGAGMAGKGAVPLPGGGVPLPGGGGAVPLPGGGVPLPGAGAGVPLPGASRGGGIPLPGGGGGGIPLPGGGIPLPGGGGGVPMPGGGVPLPGGQRGGGVPLPGGANKPSMSDLFGGAPAAPGRGAPSMGDIFGGGAPASSAEPQSARMNDIFGSPDDAPTDLPSNPFHGTNSVAGSTDDLFGAFGGEPAKVPVAATFRVRKRTGQVLGPFDEAKILDMFRKQELVGSEDASADGVNWRPLAQIPAFGPVIQQAMSAALSGLDLAGLDLPGLKGSGYTDLPGLKGAHDADLPGLRADLPGLKGEGLIGPDGQPLSTKSLSDAELARERAARLKKKRREQRGSFAFIGFTFVLLVVLIGGAGVAAQYFTQHGWFAYKLLAPKLGIELPSEKPLIVDDKPADTPPPIELPKDVAPVGELLARDTYRAYRTGHEQQGRVVDEGKKLPPPLLPEAKKAAANQARFLGYLVVVEELVVFQPQLKSALALAEGEEVAKAIGEVALLYVDRKFDDGLAMLATLADPARGLPPEQLGEVLTWRGIGQKLKNENDAAMKSFDEALQAWPRSLSTIYQQAELLVKVGEPVAARGYLQKILDNNKEHPRANLLLGNIEIANSETRAEGEKRLLALAKGDIASDAGPSQQAASHMGIARLALGDRRWDEALNNMNKAVELVPSNKDIRIEHGDLALQLREFAVARDSFQRLLDADPNDEGALIGLARSKIGARDGLGAFSDLETAVKAKPDNAQLAYWLGVAAKELLKTDVAKKQIEQAAKLDPKLPGPHVFIVQSLIDEGKLKDALNRTGVALEQVGSGDRNHLRVLKARIFTRQRSFSLAKKELEQAIKENPRNVEARVEFADLLIIGGDLKAAESEVKQALLLDPRNPVVIAANASVNSAKGQHEKAIELLEEASSLAPNEYTLYLRAAVAAIALGDLARAKGFVDTAGQLQPDNPEVINLRGQVLRATDPAQASRLFVQAIDMSPDDPRLRYELGVTYQGMGANLEAIDRFLEAIKIDPGFADAYFKLGRTYRELGRNKEAESSFRESAKLDKTRADAWVEIAEIQATLGDPENAIDSFKRAMKADPDNSDPVCKMGLTMVERLGEKKSMLLEGVKILQRCVAMNPASANAYRKLADAYKDQGKLGDARNYYKKHLDVNPQANDRGEVCDILRDLKAPCADD